MSDTELKQSLEREREALARARDEIKLQLHLGKAEVQKEWDELERKWDRVEVELRRFGEHAKEPLGEVGKAARSLLQELKGGYERVKKQLE